MTKYLMCILLMVGMTMGTACLVVSFIYGEAIFAIIFIILLGLLAREFHVESNRLQDY